MKFGRMKGRVPDSRSSKVEGSNFRGPDQYLVPSLNWYV